jgi:hypothetical protein
MGECIDSNPELANGIRLLVDLAINPTRMEHQRGRKPADSPSDDDDLHDHAY